MKCGVMYRRVELALVTLDVHKVDPIQAASKKQANAMVRRKCGGIAYV